MKTLTIDDNTFVFVNESKGNRAGFYHRTQLYMNNYLLVEKKCQYYNRTWERYTFQSVMKSAVWILIDSRGKDLIDNYKKDNDLKRLSKEKKSEIINSDETISMYRRLTDEL